MNDRVLLSQAQYARHRGCSQVSVHRAVAAGRITLVDGLVDPILADREWEQNTRVRARNVTSAGSAATGRGHRRAATDGGGYADARARREEAEAGLAEAALAELQRSLVRRDDVDRGLYEAARAFRDRLANCASRLAADVAVLATAEECYEVIAREHRAALELMVKDCRALLGPLPAPEPAE